MPHIVEILANLALFLLAGWVPAHLLLPDEEDRPLRAPLAGILGLALVELLALNLFVAGVPTGRSAWLIAGSAALAPAGFYFWRRPAIDRSEWRWPATLAGIALGIAAWPGLIAGGDRYMALANLDANNYQFLADYFREQTFRTPVELDGYHPGRLHIYNAQKTGDRIGPDLVLSTGSVLWGRSTKGEYFFLLAALAALLPVASYVFCRLGLGLAPPGARMAATLTACSSLGALLVFQQLLGHLTGAVLAPVLFGAALRLLRRPGTGIAILTGLLLAAQVAAYPEMLFLLGPAWVAAGIVLWRSGQTALNAALGRGIGIAVAVAAASNAYYGYRAVEILLQQSSGQAGGDSYAFAVTPWLWPVALGLAPFFHASHAFLGIPGAVWVALGVLLAAGLAVVARLAWREAALRPAVAGLAVTAALGAVLLLGRGYSYGGFKALLYGYFLATAVAGGMWASDWLPTGNRRALYRASLAAVLAANVAAGLWTGAFTLGYPAGAPPASAFLTGDGSFDELEREAALLPEGQTVLVDVDHPAAQLWTVYALRGRRVDVRHAHEYLAFWSRLFRVPVEHGWQDALVVRETGRAEIAAPGGRRIWSGGRLELRTLEDYAVVGEGWYGLEGSGAETFRWLEREGEIVLARPAGGETALRFEAIPGPGGAGPERTVEVWLGEERIHTARIHGPETVTTPVVRVSGEAARFRIRVLEPAEPLPNDPRRLSLQVRKVRFGTGAETPVVSGGPAVATPAPAAASPAPAADAPFADGWAGARVAFALERPQGKRRLRVSGEVPGFAGYRFPYTLAVTVNGRSAGTVKAGAPGRFSEELALPPAAAGAAERVVVTPGATFQPSRTLQSEDTRTLSVRGLTVEYR